MLVLIPAWLILVLAGNPAIQRLRNNFYSKFTIKREKLTGNPNSPKIDRTISSTFVLLFITFALTWYMYISSSSAFNAIIHIGDHIASSIFTDFLNPEATEGLRAITAERHHTLLNRINQAILYLNQIFIIIGSIVLLLKYRELKSEKGYTAFSMLRLGICFAGVFVPFFASTLHMTRLYHLTLFFLAPCCVIGGITVLRALSKTV